MKMPKKKLAFEQLVAIALLWLCTGALTGVVFFVRGALPTDPFPVKELTKFIGWEQLLVFAASASLLFAMFKAFGHRAEADDRRRSDEYAELALDEIGSALYHFGALLLVCAFVGAAWWYAPVGLASWYLGYRFKPSNLLKPSPAQSEV